MSLPVVFEAGQVGSTLGRAWMLPCSPAVTTRALVGLLARALGRSGPWARGPYWIL